MEEAPPGVPAEVCLYIRDLLTFANDHEILKGASFSLTPNTNVLCQRMANEVHRVVLPGDGHVTAMEAIKQGRVRFAGGCYNGPCFAQTCVCSHGLSKYTNATKVARARNCPRAEAEAEVTAISTTPRRRL